MLKQDFEAQDFDSPLIREKPKLRNTGKNYIPNPDDFDDVIDVEVESTTESPTAPPSAKFNASDFDDPDSPPMPHIVEAEGEEGEQVEDKNAQEREKVIENGQKMLIDTGLEFVKWGAPQGVHWLTQVDEAKLNKWAEANYIFKAAYEPQAPAIAQTNKQNLEKFESITARYVGFIDKPIRQIVRDREVAISPEMQVLGATLIFVAWIGFVAYGIRQENQKNMAKFETAFAESMKEVERNRAQLAKEQVEEAKRKEAGKSRKVEDVTAEEVV